MELSKNKRIVLYTTSGAFLLVLPQFLIIYYQSLYYLLVLVLTIVKVSLEFTNWKEKQDDRFYLKWKKARQNSFFLKVSTESLDSFVYLTILVVLGQLFALGRTPIKIISILSTSSFLKLLTLLVIISIISGVTALYEKEKRYFKLYLQHRNS